MKQLDLLRHAERMKGVDALSPEGRSRAESLGRTLPRDYTAMFVSPAYRTAETVAWILRGSRQTMPDHALVPGLASREEDGWRAATKEVGSSRLDLIQVHDPELVARESKRMAEVVTDLFEHVPNGSHVLAVSHTPLIEAAVYALTGAVLEPLAECEGVRITLGDEDEHKIEELRRGTIDRS